MPHGTVWSLISRGSPHGTDYRPWHRPTGTFSKGLEPLVLAGEPLHLAGELVTLGPHRPALGLHHPNPLTQPGHALALPAGGHAPHPCHRGANHTA